MERIEHHRCFGGAQEVWQHASATLGCTMRAGVYLPPQAAERRCPVLYWLSGLTCTEQNFIVKGGAQRYAAEHGLILVAPDTSPRGAGVADDEHYDLGQGAGFYVDATQDPWRAHYRMHDYVARELPALVEAHFPATAARGISGHSMGGHGALVLALRHPGRYRSVSAFSPIVAPSHVPWGEKALDAYLGPDRATWRDWAAAVAGRPGRCGRIPRDPASAGAPACCLRSRRPPAHPAPAAGLRPQLLLHRELHRRAHRLACQGARCALTAGLTDR